MHYAQFRILLLDEIGTRAQERLLISPLIGLNYTVLLVGISMMMLLVEMMVDDFFSCCWTAAVPWSIFEILPAAAGGEFSCFFPFVVIQGRRGNYIFMSKIVHLCLSNCGFWRLYYRIWILNHVLFSYFPPSPNTNSVYWVVASIITLLLVE